METAVLIPKIFKEGLLLKVLIRRLLIINSAGF